VNRYHQVAVQLPGPAFEILKRLSRQQRQPYAQVIAAALALASQPLVNTSVDRPTLVYAELPVADRKAWREKVQELRRTGLSYAAIAKRLFLDHGLTGADGLPLSASTIRGMVAL